MIHPDTQLRWISDDIGYGVFVTRPIPRGTVVWVRCAFDIAIPVTELAAYPAAYGPIIDRFAYLDPQGNAILCWDHGRYVNHSCQPAMLPVGEVAEIAARDLLPGDQLTCEYAFCNIVEPLECHCGASGCRGRIHADDVFVHGAAWKAQIEQALADSAQVEQPLLPFVAVPDTLLELLARRTALPPVTSYHYAPTQT